MLADGYHFSPFIPSRRRTVLKTVTSCGSRGIIKAAAWRAFVKRKASSPLQAPVLSQPDTPSRARALAWDRSSSSHLNFLPALQIVHIFQNLPPPGSLLGLPQPTFRLPSASPVTKLTCSLKSLNYLPCTQWFLVLFSEPVSWIVSSPRWGCVFCVGNPTVPNVYSPG